MSTYVNTQLSKICHARPGRIIRLPDPATGEVQPERFVIIAVDLEKPSRRKKPPYGSSAGLYNEERELLLVSLDTGRTRRMPHLSSRADITELKLEDVLEEVATVPVLVSHLEDTQIRVTLSSAHGRVHQHLNLGRPADVMALLERLVENADHVTEVKTIKQLTDEEEMARWRLAVGAGETLLSFDEFRSQGLA